VFNGLVEGARNLYADFQAANRAHSLATMAREGTDMGTVIHRFEDLTLDEVAELARRRWDPTGHQDDLPAQVIHAEMRRKIGAISDVRPDIGQRLMNELKASEESQE